MIKKIRNLVFLFFLTSSCGYNPIYEEGSKFFLISVDLDGDKKINRVIYGKLYSFLKDNQSEKRYKLKIISNSSKEAASKDSKGNLDTFNLIVKVDLILEDLNKNITRKTFAKNITYNNTTNKFDLSRYERSTRNNLAEKISEEIIIFIQTIE